MIYSNKEGLLSKVLGKGANEQINTLVSNSLHYIVQVAAAVIILSLGWWIINKGLEKFDQKIEQYKKMDASLKSFMKNFIHFGLRGALILVVLNIVGIQTTSIVAVLGAASFAIGLALQGSLANFAGGVLIIMFKPFKIGDVIEAHNKVGRVREIQLFNSIMITNDNKTVIIPNGKLTGEILTNYTKLGSVQSDIEFKVKPNVDILALREEIFILLKAMPEILNVPQPSVYLKDFDNGSVTLILRFNIAVGHSTATTFKVKEQIYYLVKKLEDQGIISAKNHEDMDLSQNLVTEMIVQK